MYIFADMIFFDFDSKREGDNLILYNTYLLYNQVQTGEIETALSVKNPNLPPWFKPRRSVETSFKFYNPPSIIWKQINTRVWPYRLKKFETKSIGYFVKRDLAFMCLIYTTTARVGELCRASVRIIDEEGISPKGKITTLKYHSEKLLSLMKTQVVFLNDGLMRIRGLRVIKRHVKSLREYPVRLEIKLPLSGDLYKFVEPIVEYFNMVEGDGELFKFGTKRGFQIVNYATGSDNLQGFMPHYLREMGLKMWLRIFDKNIATLKTYSGHDRYENLLRYLGELETERNLNNIKLE